MATSLLLQFIFLALTLFSTSRAAHPDEAVDYWKSFYPDIPIPSLVSKHISQMSSADIDTVVSLIHKKTLSSNIPLFCKTAGLICSTEEISKKLSQATGTYTGCKVNYAGHTQSTLPVIETLKIFFRETSLKKGTKFNMGDIKREVSPAKAFLPYPIASLLKLEQFGVLLQNTTIKDNISMPIMMCNSHSPYEIMKCPSSVEELVDFSAEVFQDKRLKVLYPKTGDGERTTVLFDNIRPVLRKNAGGKFMACHELFFPYTILFCHATSNVQVYQVDLLDPETLKTINADMVAVCHRDTSYWSPNHIAMIALRSRPGEGSICHWMSTDAIAFVHLDDTLAPFVDLYGILAA